MKMKQRKLITTFMVALLLVFAMLPTTITSYATSSSKQITKGDINAVYTTLVTTCVGGKYTCTSTGRIIDNSANTYKASGGGIVTYSSIWDLQGVTQAVTNGNTSQTYNMGGNINEFFDTVQFGKLTNKSKKAFLTDVLTICNAMAYDTEMGVGTHGVTDETVSAFVEQLSGQAGMGTTMLTSILQNTKPNYTAANRIYQPFSGIVGTVLGVISVVIMALLGVSMALDIAYLTIPAFNMMCTGNETGQSADGKNSRGSTLGGLISKEAKKAYKAADGGEGAQGQGGAGDYKASVGVYLKYRWTGLLLLGICLLYLVQGQIYTLVAWVIDLASGFLDF